MIRNSSLKVKPSVGDGDRDVVGQLHLSVAVHAHRRGGVPHVTDLVRTVSSSLYDLEDGEIEFLVAVATGDASDGCAGTTVDEPIELAGNHIGELDGGLATSARFDGDHGVEDDRPL